MAIDESKLNEFMGNFVRDMGAVAHASTIVIGDQLGLYKALAERPMTAAELATRTECDARYVLEWLSAQAASACARSRHWPWQSRAARRSFRARSRSRSRCSLPSRS